MSCLLSPSGPMIAVFFVGSSGSTPPSFFSSTIERPAALRAAARFSGSSCLLWAASDVHVRVLEQPGAELDPQQAPNGVVYPTHGDVAAGHELAPEVAEVRGHHFQVRPGVQRLAGSVPAVLRHAVAARAAGRVHTRTGAQLGHGRVVALDEPVEAPALLQRLGLQVAVRAPGHAVDRVERAHERVGPRVHGRLERRQVEVPEPLDRHVGGVVVATGVGLAVGGEVLDARDHLVRRAVVAPLRALRARQP